MLAFFLALMLRQEFNKDFVRMRINVECAIGILKKRFAILQKPMQFDDLTDCSKMFQVLCCLHNFCLEHADSMDLTDEPLDTTTFAEAGNEESDHETDADDEVTLR